jgi:peptidoglycan/LPS O-acetylase OafA/YrhL
MYANFCIIRYRWPNTAVEHNWSISVEEQFYVAVPFLVQLRGKTAVALVSGTTIVMSYLTLFWLAMYHAVSLLRNMDEQPRAISVFCGGALIAIVFRDRRLRLSISIRTILFVLGAVLLWVVAGPCELHSITQLGAYP